MRGTVAKRLRRLARAATVNMPALAYEVKEHLVTVKKWNHERGEIEVGVVMRKQVLLTPCQRLMYKGLKGVYYGTR